MNTKPNVMVTGFEPFSVYPVNSSWQAAKLLEDAENNIRIKELKVDHAEASRQLLTLLQSGKPDILLLSGLADRAEICLETKACKPAGLAPVEGPDVLYGVWPFEEALKALKRLNIPSRISENAGNYVCESTYWSALNFKRINGYPAFVGFLHVPVLSGGWTTASIAAAMTVLIDVARAHFSTDNFPG